MRLFTSLKLCIFANVIVATLLGISGCSKGLSDNQEINALLDGAPSWVTESNGDLLSATGSAKIKNGNINFATAQAGATARNELATQISTKVESKYKELATGSEDNVDQEAVLAIRISVSQMLAGSKITNKWISKDGSTLWVLVKIEKLNIDLLKNNFLNSKSLDKAAAAALSQAVDEIIDAPTR